MESAATAVKADDSWLRYYAGFILSDDGGRAAFFMVLLVIILSGGFGVIAAAMAYLITYKEYQHHYPTEGEPRRAGRRMALAAFVFFLSLGVMAGVILAAFWR